MSSEVLVATIGRTTRVTLNRPETRNALTKSAVDTVAEDVMEGVMAWTQKREPNFQVK